MKVSSASGKRSVSRDLVIAGSMPAGVLSWLRATLTTLGRSATVWSDDRRSRLRLIAGILRGDVRRLILAPDAASGRLMTFVLNWKKPKITGVFSDESARSAGARRLAPLCSGFIFTHHYLDGILNPSGRPSMICAGDSRVVPERDDEVERKFHDDRIHILFVYIPGLETQLSTILEASEDLPADYAVHIITHPDHPLDSGAEKELDAKIREAESHASPAGERLWEIGAVSDGAGGCQLIREPHSDALHLEALMRRCHIGVVPHCEAVDGLFSKALTSPALTALLLRMMANGLSVVTFISETMSAAGLSAPLHTYSDPTPQGLAGAILECEIPNACRRTLQRFNDRQSLRLPAILEAERRSCGSQTRND